MNYYIDGHYVETYCLLPIIVGYVWSALMLLLSLARKKILDRKRKSQDEQLEVGDQAEMKPSLQVSLEN